MTIAISPLDARSRFALALGAALIFVPGTAQAQCGYGTSSQDCMHQQRDAEAARVAEQEYLGRQQGEANGYDGDAGSSSPRPSPPAYGYVAVVWHMDAADVWATWNRRSEGDAIASAQSACRNIMGEGCTVALSAWNSTVAVAKGSNGALATGWGATPEEAGAKALENCSRNLPGCQVIHRFTAKPLTMARDHYPRSVARTHYALIAWPKDASARSSKVWIATGPEGYVSASRRLLDQCERESGAECHIPYSGTADGNARTGSIIASYYNPRRGTVWMVSPSLADARSDMEKDCAQGPDACDAFTSYDAYTSRLLSLESNPPRR